MHVSKVAIGFALAAVFGAVAGFLGFGMMSAPESWYVFWSDPLHQMLTVAAMAASTLGYIAWLERRAKRRRMSSTDKMLEYIRQSARVIRKRCPEAPVIRVPRPQGK